MKKMDDNELNISGGLSFKDVINAGEVGLRILSIAIGAVSIVALGAAAEKHFQIGTKLSNWGKKKESINNNE